jgi:hypothetical protein
MPHTIAKEVKDAGFPNIQDVQQYPQATGERAKLNSNPTRDGIIEDHRMNRGRRPEGRSARRETVHPRFASLRPDDIV